MGCPVVHWELWSEDPDKAAEFYGTVFDFTLRGPGRTGDGDVEAEPAAFGRLS